MDDEELTNFAHAFGQLAGEAFKLVKASCTIPDLVADHLGVDASKLPVIVDALPAVERPNLQLALDALIVASPESRLVGLPAELRHYGGFSIGALLSGTFRGPAEPVPPTYDELPTDVDRSLRSVTAGLWFVWLDGQPAVIGSFPADRHGPGDPEQRVEVVAPTAAHGEAVVAELQRLRHELNVYRTEGVTASFFKELVRRGTLLAVEAGNTDLAESHITSALAELLDHAAPVMRAMLGIDAGDDAGSSSR